MDISILSAMGKLGPTARDVAGVQGIRAATLSVAGGNHPSREQAGAQHLAAKARET